MRKVLLKTESLSKSFSSGGAMQHVLKNIDLELYEGDFTVIMGPAAQANPRCCTPCPGWTLPPLARSLLETG